MTPPNPLPPPRCRLSFQVGVLVLGAAVDHVGGPLVDSLRAVLSEMAAIVAEPHPATGSLAASKPPVSRLVSTLAGAEDVAAAEAALAAGYELCVVSPDVAPGTAADAIIRRAATVLSLTGDPQAAAGLLLDQSDVLIVIRDGAEAAEADPLLAPALARDLPVVTIDRSTRAVRLPGDGADRWEALRRALFPFDSIEREHRDVRSLPRRYFAATRSDPPWYGRVHRAVERSLLVGHRRPAPPAIDGGPEPDAPPAPPPSFAAPRALEAHFAAADALAVRFACLYRSLFTIRYLLLLPAMVGLAVGFYGAESIKWEGFALQAAALAAIVAVSRINGRQRWHEALIDCRILAELLRHQRVLSAIGVTLPAIRFPAHRSDPDAQWINWLFRVAVRESGPGSGVIDDAVLARARARARADLVEQVAYHAAAGDRCATLARRLERLGNVSFVLGMAFVLVRPLVFALLPPDFGGGGFDAALATVVRERVNMVSLILVALAPVFHGLRSQGEYARLSRQYAAMEARLRDLIAQLDRAPLSHAAISRLAIAAAELMVSEVADWRQIVKARPVSAT